MTVLTGQGVRLLRASCLATDVDAPELMEMQFKGIVTAQMCSAQHVFRAQHTTPTYTVDAWNCRARRRCVYMTACTLLQVQVLYTYVYVFALKFL